MKYIKCYFKDVKVGRNFFLKVEGVEYRKTTSDYNHSVAQRFNTAVDVSTGREVDIEPNRPVYVKFI